MTARPAEHLYPSFHVRPPSGWVNDPNGPIWHDGTYHLFYQYRPSTGTGAPVFWGHATSPDLAIWEHHRAAMGPVPGGLDVDGVWSGNTISRGRDLIAYYSGNVHGKSYQSVLKALSTDGGYSFGNPELVVQDPGHREKVAQLRDPFVWQQADGWRMVVGAGLTDGTPLVRIHSSVDLRTWTAASTFARRPESGVGVWDLGSMWECPQVIDFADRRVLIVSTWHASGGLGQVLALTDASGSENMADPDIRLVDQGRDFYAAGVLRDGPDGPIMWGWAPEAREHSWYMEDDWAGMLSLPRLISPGPGQSLKFTPPKSLDTLRVGNAVSLDCQSSNVPPAFELCLLISSNTEIVLRTGGDEQLRIEIDVQAGRIVMDRSRASSDTRADTSAVEFNDSALRGELRVFFDGSIIELFTPSGQVATLRFYPTQPPPWILNVSGEDGEVQGCWWPLRGQSRSN
jgi:beta-fructofuranosidase